MNETPAVREARPAFVIRMRTYQARGFRFLTFP
jgi:hypothetical protein